MILKNLNYVITGVVVTALVSVNCHAQNQTKFILKLNDSLIENMKSLGSLNSVVPEEARGKVSSIEVQFETVDSAVAAVNANAPVSMNGEACMVPMTDDLIEKSKIAPLRFTVPAGSSFIKVFLKYPRAQNTRNGAPNLRAKTTPVKSSKAISEPAAEHFVILSEQEIIEGQIDITDKMKFNTRFGDVEIGIDQIKGIRFHVDGNGSAMIVLNNGDTVTGIPELESLNLKTEWGRAEFDPKSVQSLVTRRNARFRPNPNTSGSRWILIE